MIKIGSVQANFVEKPGTYALYTRSMTERI
jgi:hypothetical protein